MIATILVCSALISLAAAQEDKPQTNMPLIASPPPDNSTNPDDIVQSPDARNQTDGGEPIYHILDNQTTAGDVNGEQGNLIAPAPPPTVAGYTLPLVGVGIAIAVGAAAAILLYRRRASKEDTP